MRIELVESTQFDACIAKLARYDLPHHAGWSLTAVYPDCETTQVKTTPLLDKII